ncbi:MAG: MetQ/NlpA family ABC transporter substrate-binding protein [Treponema sp.]|nr:MetQ/NlpA family ABC transporter substrate-binding protein [Treponema sp.]MCL2272500.1 MetQ/NlpA family ABC transporter substrate-binding protein [Treponema sp.]
MKSRFLSNFGCSLLLACVLLAFSGYTAAAGGNKEKSGSVLTVGATPVPHAELLNLIKDDLAKQGITLKVVEFTDYVTPNSALVAGDLDANFFQHIPYLESNTDWTARLSSAFGVHIEPFGLYSSKFKNIADLPNGATIAIPNDPTNGGRALLLLQSKGLITLRAGAGLNATSRDITSNPKNLRFRELEAALLPRSLSDVEAATINGNYALQAGFNPLNDSLIIEGADSPYVNIVVVQKGKEQDAKITALKNVLLSPRVKDYINKTYNGGVVSVF